MFQWIQLGIAGFKLHSALQNASMIEKQGQLQKKIMNMNAKWKDREAWKTEQYGYTVSARYKAKADKVLGQQKAIFEYQNVQTEGTSAQEIQQDTETTAFLNTIDIQRQARNQAMKSKFEAVNIRLGANNAALEGKVRAASARQAAFMEALDTGVNMLGGGAGGGGGITGYGGGGPQGAG